MVEALKPGDRVQLFNPGALGTGVVKGEPSVTGHVAIKWDDGERGYALTELLRKLDDESAKED